MPYYIFRSKSTFCLSHISVLILNLIIYTVICYFNTKYDKSLITEFLIINSLDQILKQNNFIFLYTKVTSRLINYLNAHRKYGGKRP